MIRKLTKKQQEQPKGGQIMYEVTLDACDMYCKTFCVDSKEYITKQNCWDAYKQGQTQYRES